MSIESNSCILACTSRTYYCRCSSLTNTYLVFVSDLGGHELRISTDLDSFGSYILSDL